MSTSIQPMPDLTPEQYTALREDIAEHGIRVPIVKDQNDRILDGNNRAAIAAELGIEVPSEIVTVADDDEAHDIAVTLNCARRHLNQEQTRELIRNELRRRFGDSDRAVARRLGCSPTTVGTIRKEMRAEAEHRTEAIREAMRQGARDYFRAAHELLLLGADLTTMLERANAAKAEVGTSMQGLGEDAIDNPVILIKFYVFTTLANDLGDLADVLPHDLTVPRKVSAERLAELMNDVFDVSRLDTIGGGRHD